MWEVKDGGKTTKMVNMWTDPPSDWLEENITVLKI